MSDYNIEVHDEYESTVPVWWKEQMEEIKAMKLRRAEVRKKVERWRTLWELSPDKEVKG